MEKNNGKEKRARELFAKEVQEEKANKGWKYNRNLLETSIDSLVTIGPDGIITDVNSATEKATGLPREKIIGTDFSEYFTEPDKARVGYKQVFDIGKVVDYELYLKHINGSSIPVLYNASVYKDNEGQIIGVFATARDISAIKKHENELIDFGNNLELIVQQKTAELIIANKELAFQNEEKEKRAAELVIADKELAFQTGEKADRAAELVIADKELAFQTGEKADRAAELVIADEELVFQIGEKADRAAELVIADEELVFQIGEKADRAAELLIANKELAFQNEEKEKRAAELIIANKELVFQNEEKDKRATELIVANKELAFQNEEKDKRAAELVLANRELIFQTGEKADRAAELVIADKELAFQTGEKADRAAELIIANRELIHQNEEKDKRAAELVIANKELVFQNEEKEKRAAELIIANKELAFQNEEKEKRAVELIIANKELAFQNEEKEKRAAELIIANKELAFQNEEKEKRAVELIIANKELVFRNEEISYISYHDFLTGLYNRIYFEEEKKRLDTPRQLPISIIMGDINGLKLVNDGFGHSKGDELLIEIAKILKSCCREEDIISRIGGDEFGILLSQTDSKSAQLVCSRIYDTCKGYALDGSSIYPSISVGHATKNIETETMDNILMAAEESMSKQKLLESKSAHSSILASIKAIMFEKSQETEEHAERMVQLSKSIGLAMSLTDDQLNELELLSTLHDIGKMSIDAEILSKPGKLSDKEWVEMRKHPEVGFRIAQATSELIPIADYILCHHERWDGKGYPQGLIGEKIPLLSRIVAIADSFDAMTNDRAYRSAMTKGEAIEEIRRNSGTQFDPEVTRVFIEKVLGQEWEQLNRAEA